jgi:peptide/nickel transport system ATP-binding protein
MDVNDAALEMQDLRIEVSTGDTVIDGVSLRIERGEIVALVGESGSGKTTTALSIFGYVSTGLKKTAGEVSVAGTAMTSPLLFRRARGRLVSYVPQNPGTALNPSLRVAQAIEDMVREESADQPAASARVDVLIDRVGLPASREFTRRFPHQLSGGQQQRVCIAAALASGPALVVLDEPTTGLDVVSQDRVLQELLRLRDTQHVTMLYITHDLAVAAQIANRIVVMYGGQVVEHGPASEILRQPRHPYTRGLMASTPDHLRPRVLEVMRGTVAGVGERPSGCSFASRCPQAVPQCQVTAPDLIAIADDHEVRCPEWQATPPVTWTRLDAGGSSDQPTSEPVTAVVLDVAHLRAEYRLQRHTAVAVSDVSFSLRRGGCVALVGESGSGKTTIARVIAGLHSPAAGSVKLDGHDLPGLARRRSTDQLRRIQIVFQNPTEALNPRHTVRDAVERPARVLQRMSGRDADLELRRLLDAVRLPSRMAERYPRELSGGEVQRVAIARALAAGPEVIVCDEITSALDVSVQAAVLELLRDLRGQMGVALLFITHDLGIVATVADRVLVLNRGEICEEGQTSAVLGSPQHEYTQRLLAAAPSLAAAIDLWEAGPAADGHTGPGAPDTMRSAIDSHLTETGQTVTASGPPSDPS